jgi:hypothetical protein
LEVVNCPSVSAKVLTNLVMDNTASKYASALLKEELTILSLLKALFK